METRFVINGQGVCLSKEITESLESGRYLQLVKSGEKALVKKIDFAHELVRESFNTCPYEIMWHTTIPNGKANELVCLFPNHEDRANEQKHVLKVKSYWSLSSLNKQINKRFKASLDHTDSGHAIKFAICYGQHVYVCSGISGNIYLFWARHINRTNHGNTPNTLFHDVPCIVNTTGNMRVRGLYILRDQVLEDADLLRVPLMEGSPVFLQDDDVDLFVCEVRDTPLQGEEEIAGADPITLRQKGYSLMTRKAAMARILSPTPQLQKQQQNSAGCLTDGISADWEHNAYVDLQLIHDSSLTQ